MISCKRRDESIDASLYYLAELKKESSKLAPEHLRINIITKISTVHLMLKYDYFLPGLDYVDFKIIKRFVSRIRLDFAHSFFSEDVSSRINQLFMDLQKEFANIQISYEIEMEAKKILIKSRS